MDDKAKAAYYRELADVNERHGKPSLAAVQRRSADRLDPPKPEYPVGTIAWVTLKGYPGRRVWRRTGTGWGVGDDFASTPDDFVESIEVIPTLPEGYVAVKDVTARTGWSAEHVRHVAQEIKKVGWTSAPRILDAYADALEAKDNQ